MFNQILKNLFQLKFKVYTIYSLVTFIIQYGIIAENIQSLGGISIIDFQNAYDSILSKKNVANYGKNKYN